jgi:hypothetical protein
MAYKSTILSEIRQKRTEDLTFSLETLQKAGRGGGEECQSSQILA